MAAFPPRISDPHGGVVALPAAAAPLARAPGIEHSAVALPATLAADPAPPQRPIEAYLSFVGIDADTRASLAENRSALSAALPKALESFFAFLLSSPATKFLLSDPETLRRVRNGQLDHLLRLLSGLLDEAYAEDTRRLGASHARLGMDANQLMGAYGVLLQRLLPLAVQVGQREAQKGERLARAISQCVLLEIQLILDASLGATTLSHVQHERQAAERVLQATLPGPAIEDLKAGRRVAAKQYDDTTVVLADLEGFAGAVRQLDPDSLIAVVDLVFSAFDLLAAKNGLEKVKQLGDRYLLVGGIPVANPDVPRGAVATALAMTAFCEELSRGVGVDLRLRVAVNRGPIVGGVFGTQRLSFDICGETLSLCGLMQPYGAPGRVHITESVRAAATAGHSFESHSPLLFKEYGRVRSFFVRERRAPERRRADSIAVAKEVMSSSRIAVGDTPVIARIERWLAADPPRAST